MYNFVINLAIKSLIYKIKIQGGNMELKDIQELMKVLKKENIAELKVRYGKVKLTLTRNSYSCITSRRNYQIE